MKKKIYTAVTVSILFLTGCGSSISSDAQKVAELQCEVQELQQKAGSGDASNAEDIKEFMAEAAKLMQEMNSKYASLKEKQEFSEALMKAKADCN